MLAFRAACHCNDEDADSDTYAFIIDNSSVFNQLILFCLRNMHKIFNNLLNYSPNTGALNVYALPLLLTTRTPHTSHTLHEQ